MHKIGQPGGFLDRLIGPMLKTGSPLMENVLKPLAKRVLTRLGLTATSPAYAAIHNKVFESERPSDLASLTTILIFSNEEMNDIMKVVNSLE